MAADNEKDFHITVLGSLIFGWVILFFHLYIVNSGALARLGIDLSLLDIIIIKINRQTRLFSNLWLPKLTALFFVLFYTYGYRTKKDITMTWQRVYVHGLIGLILLLGGTFLLLGRMAIGQHTGIVYSVTTLAGYLFCINAGSFANRIVRVQLDDDPFNEFNQSFLQEERLLQNEYSVNIPTQYTYRNKIKNGWVNIINPFRATLIMGTPGSGKSFAVVNNFIRQHIEKGFSMYIYDFKFPDLSIIAYNYLLRNADVYRKKYGVNAQLYLINFDDPRRSHRCNPIRSDQMTDVVDANEAATTILLNLSKSWIKKEGEFFIESPKAFLAGCIWYMKLLHDRVAADADLKARMGYEPDEPVNLCTFPHVIQFASRRYDEIFPLMMAEPELEELIQPFQQAFANKTLEQLDGQIASARIPLIKIISPQLYWVMSGDDFDLTLNDRKAPKILCTGNNPDRAQIYGAALGLYNARLVKKVNRPGRVPCSMIIDELPTIYFRGLDQLIATARSNKVSTCLSFQDKSQINRDYGKEEAEVILNTPGNLVSGSVKGNTARDLSNQFGKNVQRSQSFNFNERDTTSSISQKLDSLIPESVISNLSQGRFVGNVADNDDQPIPQKTFHSKFIIDKEMIAFLSNLKPIPQLPQFEGITDAEVEQKLKTNFLGIKADVANLVRVRLEDIRADVDLRYLLNGLKTKEPDYLRKVEEDDDES